MSHTALKEIRKWKEERDIDRFRKYGNASLLSRSILGSSFCHAQSNSQSNSQPNSQSNSQSASSCGYMASTIWSSQN